ncbi:zinc ribbon domain-containing protein [Dyella sp. S184]|jgi:putative FmdB family regulatory protein|uniref:FmdB family zinc ribbon protein n=1 Tax=Dyella sp. S184 TaxID=1641862 RepID=UPI00131D24AA|nr:zinc ribbon domain-containing protein [Dyella sp. S184]
MPIYEFECSGCGHRFDRLQKLSDTDPSICPACDAPQLRRRVSAPSFRLAGSGWYETDFKKDGDKKRNLAGDAGGSGDSKAPPAADKAAAAPAAPPAPTAPIASSGGTSGSSD